MSIGANELFEMLEEGNSEEVQRRGIEEGKKIKYISILIKPLENKKVWNNCAKIIAQKPDEIIADYKYPILEWLKDENDPGFDIIYNRIKSMPVQLIKLAYKNKIHKARKQNNEKWLLNLSRLIENKELYEYLSIEDRNIMNKYFKKTQLMRKHKEMAKNDIPINQTKLEIEDRKMQIGINEMFEMLKWESDELEQKKAIEEGRKVKYMSIFLQNGPKSVWENCAKIIASKTDEELKPYLIQLFQWLEDFNWPGTEIIYNRLQSIPDEFIIDAFTYNMREYIKMEDDSSIVNFVTFAYCSEFFTSSQESKERKLFEKFTAQEMKTIKNKYESYN